jgi:hypothetical protein
VYRQPEMARPFSIVLSYDVPDLFLDVPTDGAAFAHTSGVRVRVGYRPDGTPMALTESDHVDDDLLELIETFESSSEPETDDPRIRTFMDSVRKTHRSAANDIVAILRWTMARPGGARAVGRRLGAHYIVAGDGQLKRLPMRRLAPLAGVRGRVPVDDSWRGLIEAAAVDGEEPLGHLILHEANDQISTHPRSAIVLTMTALEVALNQQLGRLARRSSMRPGALPWEGASHAISGEVGDGIVKAFRREPDRWRTIPSWAAGRIEEGRKRRNGVVHEGKPPPSREDLLALARVVRDALYLLDYQAGHEWALRYVGFLFGDEEQVFGTPVFIGIMADD